MKVITRENDEVLYSEKDDSINRVKHIDLSKGESVETRIIQRNPDTMIIYLSTAKSCHLSCRMCHLTQTGQASNLPLDETDFEDQMDWVVEQLENDTRVFIVDTIHINFMARGDGLSNIYFVSKYNKIQKIIRDRLNLIFNTNCTVKFKISTIFPLDCIYTDDINAMKKWINETTANNEYGETEFYYSLYSLDPKFRKKWLPKSHSPEYVGHLFNGHRPVDNVSRFRLHHALIKEGNDKSSDIQDIKNWLSRHDIVCFMNIVRYNPYDESCGEETSEENLDSYISQIQENSNVALVQLVSRLDPEVFAACGMFYK